MQNKREKILAIAEKLFGERGFQGVSVRDITREAQVNVSAVNYYFGSKKDLYLAVFKELWIKRAKKQQEYLKAKLESQPNLDFQKLVYEVILSFLTGPICKDIKKYHHALIQRELFEPTEALELVRKEAIFPMIELLSFYLENIAPGKFSLEEKKTYSIAIVGLAVHFNTVYDNLKHILGREDLTEFVSNKLSHLLTWGFLGLSNDK